MIATVLYSAAVHAVFVAKPRYNFPPLPLLVAAGCAGAVLLWREWRAPVGNAEQSPLSRMPGRRPTMRQRAAGELDERRERGRRT